jgi:hypothetical protein
MLFCVQAKGTHASERIGKDRWSRESGCSVTSIPLGTLYFATSWCGSVKHSVLDVEFVALPFLMNAHALSTKCVPKLPILDTFVYVSVWCDLRSMVSGHACRCVRCCAIRCPHRAKDQRRFQSGPSDAEPVYIQDTNLPESRIS